jgi:hypothetical protein
VSDVGIIVKKRVLAGACASRVQELRCSIKWELWLRWTSTRARKYAASDARTCVMARWVKLRWLPLPRLRVCAAWSTHSLESLQSTNLD